MLVKLGKRLWLFATRGEQSRVFRYLYMLVSLLKVNQ